MTHEADINTARGREEMARQARRAAELTELRLDDGLVAHVRSVLRSIDAEAITPHDGETGGREPLGKWTVSTVKSATDEVKRFLTTQELAEMLRTGPETVRYWAWKGIGPKSVKVGRKRLYARADVEAWLAAKTLEGGQP